MAVKTVTIDTGEWAYPDVTGITHLVTNAETFTFTLTDGGAAAVTYQNILGGTLATTDGLRINIRPQAENASGTGGSAIRSWGPTADTQDGSAIYGLAGEFVCECPITGILQYWKAISILVDDVDTPTAITATFEDQFGHSFKWTTVTIS